MTPKIRIKGFSGEWEEHTMKEHIHFIAGYPFNSSFFNKEGIGLRIIRNRDLHADDQITYTNESCPAKYYVKRNDLLVGMDGDFMPIRWRNEPSVLNQRVGKLICDDDWYLDFFEYALKQPLLDMQNDTGATTVKHLTNTGVENIVRKIPFSKLEQKAIASYFTTLDDMIAGAEKQIASLSQTKAACLQSMFPQEGETTPRVRFRSFEGDWEKKSVGNIGITYSGLSGKTKEDFGCGESKYITFLNVLSNAVIDPTILQNVKVSSSEHQNLVRRGDLLFNTSSETPEEVGMCSMMDKNMDNVYLNSFCFGFRVEDINIYPLFISYEMRSHIGRKLMTVLAQGATRYNLSKTNFCNSTILLPRDKEEQQKIAEYFRSLDQQIDLQKKRLEKLRQIKAACLDNMFV